MWSTSLGPAKAGMTVKEFQSVIVYHRMFVCFFTTANRHNHLHFEVLPWADTHMKEVL